MLEPEMPGAREDSKDIAKSEEDVISYVLYPQVAPDFFKQRDS
jgi:pyruvate/oxaloacetate carboxyltransferase